MSEKDFVYEDFIWNIAKNDINIAKHGVSFMEARTIFLDLEIVYVHDDEHSQDEERFIAIGLSEKPRLLMVCYCERENNTLTRIISAREANKKEKDLYIRKG